MADFKIFLETDQNVLQALNELRPEQFNNAWSATLSDVIGRTDARAEGHYNQWRTVVPHLGSLAVWTITGSSFAPGNAHVGTRVDHNPLGQNVHDNLELTQDQKSILVQGIRELFPYTEVQNDGHRRYEHRLLFCVAEITYIIKLSWDHLAVEDAIYCNIRKYNHFVAVPVLPLEAVIQGFAQLGL